MDWYCITLSEEQMEFGFVDILRAELEEIWIARGGQAHFSVWLEIFTSGTRVYLSPAAAEAARMLLYRFGGNVCPEPDTGALSFLLGYAPESGHDEPDIV
jgi:hypothetical protein